MKTSDFHFDLPEHLIAQAPLSDRSGSRMLVLDGPTGNVSHRQFWSLKRLFIRATDLSLTIPASDLRGCTDKRKPVVA